MPGKYSDHNFDIFLKKNIKKKQKKVLWIAWFGEKIDQNVSLKNRPPTPKKKAFEGLGEMFEGHSADTRARKFRLASMGGWVPPKWPSGESRVHRPVSGNFVNDLGLLIDWSRLSRCCLQEWSWITGHSESMWGAQFPYQCENCEIVMRSLKYARKQWNLKIFGI